jgi:hypothetical protein
MNTIPATIASGVANHAEGKTAINAARASHSSTTALPRRTSTAERAPR